MINYYYYYFIYFYFYFFFCRFSLFERQVAIVLFSCLQTTEEEEVHFDKT